tara:strand:+ start:1173 stop:1637 length:465 start_codon:yes stop_codon:yes gene_type:complete
VCTSGPESYWRRRNSANSICTRRHPVDRLVSAFNMGITRLAEGCDRDRLARYAKAMLGRGDADNFDVPVAAYPCDISLCLNRIESELEALMNRSFYIGASQRGIDPRILPIKLPRVRRGARGQCHASNLSATLRTRIALRYYQDLCPVHESLRR